MKACTRTVVVIIILLIGMCVSANGINYDLPKNIYVKAWSRAVKVAEVKDKYLPPPPLTYWRPEFLYNPCNARDLTCWTRVFGSYERSLIIKKGGDLDVREVIKIHIFPFEHRACPGFLHELLVHEMLHYLYTRKVLTESGFAKENPYEHEWIDTVYEFKSSCWGDIDTIRKPIKEIL